MLRVMHELLQGVPIFAGLSDEAVDFLLQKARIQEHGVGEIIFRESEPGNRLCLLATGTVDVIKGLGGETPTVLATLKRGDFFGEMCILETLPRSASVVA